MLRLYDVQAGQPEPVSGARRGELRMLIRAPGSGRRPHLGDLRSYLLPDLVRRWAERRGLQVFACELSQTAGERALETIRAEHAALNIHPPDRTSPDPAGRSAPGQPTRGQPMPGQHAPGQHAPGQASDEGPPFDLATGGSDRSPVPDGLAAHRAASTGPVTFEGRDVAGLAGTGLAGTDLTGTDLTGTDLTGTDLTGTDGDDGDDGDGDGIVWLSDVTGLGLDPLALRLTFLRHRYREPADLTWDALLAADRTLRRWRERVADWATEPSAPLVRSYADAVTSAFEDDVDSPAALRHLQALEADSAAPAGAKFETFAYLDLLLGLDLTREIGRY